MSSEMNYVAFKDLQIAYKICFIITCSNCLDSYFVNHLAFQLTLFLFILVGEVENKQFLDFRGLEVAIIQY